jgi:hypothetical protein
VLYEQFVAPDSVSAYEALKVRESKNLAPLVTFGTSSCMVWPVIQCIPTDCAALYVIADPRGKTKSAELLLSYNLTCVLDSSYGRRYGHCGG